MEWFNKTLSSLLGNKPSSDAPPVVETETAPAPVAVPPVNTGGCYTPKRSKKKKGGKKKRSYKKKKVYRQGG